MQPKIPKHAETWPTKHGENTKISFYADFAPNERSFFGCGRFSGYQLLPNSRKHLMSSLISYKSKEMWTSEDSRDVSSFLLWKQNRLKNLQHFPECGLPSELLHKAWCHDPVTLWCLLEWLQRKWCRPQFRTGFHWYFMTLPDSNSSLVSHSTFLRFWLGCMYQILHINLCLCTYIYTYIYIVRLSAKLLKIVLTMM